MNVHPLIGDNVGMIGWIESIEGSHGSSNIWIIKFPDGDTWRLTDAELDNRAHFKISPPIGLRQCLLRVKYGYEYQGLGIGDDPMFEAIEEISWHADSLLKLVDKNHPR
jgi:hypothetical protein